MLKISKTHSSICHIIGVSNVGMDSGRFMFCCQFLRRKYHFSISPKNSDVTQLLVKSDRGSLNSVFLLLSFQFIKISIELACLTNQKTSLMYEFSIFCTPELTASAEQPQLYSESELPQVSMSAMILDRLRKENSRWTKRHCRA